MAKVHLLTAINFNDMLLHMACGAAICVNRDTDGRDDILYTNSEDLLLRRIEKLACRRCLAALKKGEE